MAFENRIRELRHAREERLVDLAAVVGMSIGNLSRIERGIYDCPDPVKVKLAEHFGVPVWDLFHAPQFA